MPPRRRTTADNFGRTPSDTPISSRQKAVKEEELKVQAQLARYEKLIQDAPRLAAEREKKQREDRARRAATTEHCAPQRLPDPRYAINAMNPPRERALRHERNRGRTTFVFLFLGLLATMAWFYFSVLGQ